MVYLVGDLFAVDYCCFFVILLLMVLLRDCGSWYDLGVWVWWLLDLVFGFVVVVVCLLFGIYFGLSCWLLACVLTWLMVLFIVMVWILCCFTGGYVLLLRLIWLGFGCVVIDLIFVWWLWSVCCLLRVVIVSVLFGGFWIAGLCV